ncbi:MAG: hypothetical protein AAFO91_04375 [Bacteroidota bacterium]
MYSLNPPGNYYFNSRNSDLIINSLIDWESPRGQVLFHDKWYTYQNVPFHAKLHIIVGKSPAFIPFSVPNPSTNSKEIKRVRLKDNRIILEDFGWTVVPIFHKNGRSDQSTCFRATTKSRCCSTPSKRISSKTSSTRR